MHQFVLDLVIAIWKTVNMDEQIQSTNQQPTNPSQASPQAQVSTEPSTTQEAIQNQTVAPHQTPKWIVIALLLFFPPVAWYFMWKEKQYHSWFSIIILLYAVIPLITLGTMLLFVIPQLMELYDSLNIQNPTAPYIYPAVIGGIVISIAQILYAVYIRKQVKTHGQLSKNLLIITVTILALNYLFASLGTAAINLSVITPIYTLVNSIQ